MPIPKALDSVKRGGTLPKLSKVHLLNSLEPSQSDIVTKTHGTVQIVSHDQLPGHARLPPQQDVTQCKRRWTMRGVLQASVRESALRTSALSLPRRYPVSGGFCALIGANRASQE